MKCQALFYVLIKFAQNTNFDSHKQQTFIESDTYSRNVTRKSKENKATASGVKKTHGI